MKKISTSEPRGGLIDWLRGTMQGEGKISPGDLDMLEVTDDPNRVLAAMHEIEHRRPRRQDV